MTSFFLYIQKNLALRSLFLSQFIKLISKRYQYSYLGFLWVLISPLTQIAIYSLIIPLIMTNRPENYVLYLVPGISLFGFFSSCVSGPTDFYKQRGFFKKMDVPKLIFVLSATASYLFNMIIVLTALHFLLAILGVDLHTNLIYLVIGIVLLYLFGLGLFLILSIMSPYLKDLRNITQPILNIFFFGSPILYEISKFNNPEALKYMMFNPLYHYLEIFHQSVYEGSMINFNNLIVPTTLSIILPLTGLILLYKFDKKINIIL